MTDILVDEYAQRVYVAFETGPRVTRWIDANGMTGVQLVDPGVEPADRDDTIADAVNEQAIAVLQALAEIKVAKRVREALAEVLDVDPATIGKQ